VTWTFYGERKKNKVVDTKRMQISTKTELLGSVMISIGTRSSPTSLSPVNLTYISSKVNWESELPIRVNWMSIIIIHFSIVIRD